MRPHEIAETKLNLETQRLVDAIRAELIKRPPTVGLVGVSGVGKSSTINMLFKTALPTSHTVACTKEFTSREIQLEMLEGQYRHTPVPLRVFDAPGLGEDVGNDDQYLAMYEEYLPQCDVVLWVMSARHRAVALDQQYLRRLQAFQEKMVFGINQVDLVEPLDWSESINMPSRVQEKNAEIIRGDRSKRIASVIGREPKMVCYSAKYGYNLLLLFSTILEACPPERAWIFQSLKNFDPRQFRRIKWTGEKGLLSGLIPCIFSCPIRKVRRRTDLASQMEG